MKKIILPVLTLLFTSCAVTNYYQVYKTNSENGIINMNKIVFEDNNCSVYYDLWTEEGGNVGFSFYNKTDSDLVVDLSKTFFVINGVAHEYFQNRTFSKQTNNTTTITNVNNPNYLRNNITNVAGSSSTSFSVSYIEKPQVTIPPKTLINISEYNVTNLRYVSCNLAKYPSQRNIKSIQFGKENTPFNFYNLITYLTKSDTLRIQNKFYVNEITNYPANLMYNYIDTSVCGRKLEFSIQVLKNETPNKFYIKYSVDK